MTMSEIIYKELQRKAVHITGSLIPVAYYFLNKNVALLGLSIILVFFLIIEWLRLRGKINFPERLLRQHEKKQIGHTFIISWLHSFPFFSLIKL